MTGRRYNLRRRPTRGGETQSQLRPRRTLTRSFPDSQIPPYDQQDFSGNQIASASRTRRQNQQGERTSPNWDYQRTRVLLQIMAQLIDDGYHRRGNTLSPDGYVKLVQDFNHRTGNTLSIGQIKSKISILKRDWRAWMEVNSPIYTVTGMSWNYEKYTWDAPDSWWAWMQQVNSNVVKFRKRGLEHADLIEKVFYRTTAIGKMHWTPYAATGTPKFGQFSGVQSQAESVASSTTPPAHETGIKKRRPEQDDMTEGCSARRRCQSQSTRFSQSIDCMTNVVQKRGEKVHISFNAPGCGFDDCITKLLSMEGVNSRSELYLFACQFFSTPVHREMFMFQPDDEHRLRLLLYQKNKRDRIHSCPVLNLGVWHDPLPVFYQTWTSHLPFLL